MFLPTPLQESIELIAQKHPLKELMLASERLSETYREGEGLGSELEHIAYLCVRMPATFASLSMVFKEIVQRIPFKSVVDLGAGPGTGWWALNEFTQNLSYTSIEKDHTFTSLAKQLGNTSTWIDTDIIALKEIPPADLALFSYSLGEFPEDLYPSILDKAWKAANQALVIIEPGTPEGYRKMLLARGHLIERGGHVAAPCPHNRPCPLKEPDWCHFAARVQRTSLHRKLKEGTLNFEDEKFSYVVITKEPCPSASRILAEPKKRSGHILFHLCTVEGIQEKTISKREKELFKKARKSHWGDTIES